MANPPAAEPLTDAKKARVANVIYAHMCANIVGICIILQVRTTHQHLDVRANKPAASLVQRLSTVALTSVL